MSENGDGFVVSGQGLEADVTKEADGYRFTLSRVKDGDRKEPLTLKNMKEEEFATLLALGHATEHYLSIHKARAEEAEESAERAL